MKKFLGLSTFVASRYLQNRRDSRLLSRGGITSIVGIATGVMVLNISLSIMNGFHSKMQQSFLDNLPMISIVTSAPEGFSAVDKLVRSLYNEPGVVGVSPFVRQDVLVSSKGESFSQRQRVGVLWGVEPESVDSVVPITRRVLPDAKALAELKNEGNPGAILGSVLADSLSVSIGDTIVIVTVNMELDLANIKSVSQKFVILGFFESGMYEFDSMFVYIGIGHARSLLGYPDGGATMLGVRVEDPMQADVISLQLEDSLGRSFYATDWMAMNDPLFQWMKLEKVIMILLLGLIILVAGFNVVGVLIMMVGEKRRDVGILLALGASRGQVMGIFLLNGASLGFVGAIVGSLASLVCINLLESFGISLPGDVYLVDSIPVLFRWTDMSIVAAVTIALCLVAGTWPSWEASNFDPMEIVRTS